MNYECLGNWFCDKHKWKNPKYKIVSQPDSMEVYFIWQYVEWDKYVFIKDVVENMYEIAKRDLDVKIVF